MATSDFEEADEYDVDSDNGSIVDDIKDVKDNYQDLKHSIKEYKDNSSREFNQQIQNRNMARSGGEQVARGTTGSGATTGGATTGGATAGGATTGGATAGGATAGGAATGGAATGGAAAGGAAAGGAAAAGVSATGIGAIVVAALALLSALKKLQDKLDKKAEENGVNLKGIRRLMLASPIVAIFAIIIIIMIVIMLLTQTSTIEKTDALKQIIECAETSGCTDFMNTGVTISSASVPLGGIGGTIVAFAGEAMSAAEQTTNNNFLTTLNTTFEAATSKKLIYFTDLQIARLVIEYLMFENKYYGFTETLNQFTSGISKTLNGANGDEKNVIEWLFQLLVDHTIIGDIYEAYSLFNWLKLEKVAFNKIQWKIIYTGVSGTGIGFADDILNNFCKDTTEWWRSDALVDFCNESKQTESLTFKVVGDLNPFTAMLWVPTDLWTVGDAAINAADVFGITDKLPILQSWKASALPDQDTLVNAVYSYLPTWIEIYSLYVNTGDIFMANEVFNYYIKNLNQGGDFAINVELYALRNYEITRTLDFGDQETYYNIYDSNGDIIEYEDENGNISTASYFTESQMKEFISSREESDENESWWDKLVDFAKSLEKILREFWAGVKAALGSGWYYASNFVKDFLYTKYPLALASERTWAVAVTQGTTFDNRYKWTYEVVTNRTIENVESDASDGFSNKKDLDNINGNSIDNNSRANSYGQVVSRSIIYDTDELQVEQVTTYVNIKQEITTWDEKLNMTSSVMEPYKVQYKRQDESGNEFEEELELDNRLAYVIEKIARDPSNNKSYDSNDYSIAYEAIRAYRGESYFFSGVYTDYSNLPDGAFGWPLEEMSSVRISSCTGLRSNVFGYAGTETHGGDDIPAPEGTKIIAARSGKIIVNQYNHGGYGYYVVIDHGEGWYTLYGHMVRQSILGVGTEVQAGEVIGFVGTTGRSTGNHLHFEIRYGVGTGFWGAEKKEPLYYISKSTFPTNITSWASNCPDKSTWGV